VSEFQLGRESGDIFDIRVSLADEKAVMFSTKGYAAHSAHEPLKPFSFNRREPTPTDVPDRRACYLSVVFLSFRGRGLISSLDCVLLGHVFALPRRAVKTRACPVVNTCLGVNPHLAVAPAWRGRVGRFVDRARCRRWACGRTRCRLRLDLLWSGCCLGRSRWRLSG
jgi:hypothetical protein